MFIPSSLFLISYVKDTFTHLTSAASPAKQLFERKIDVRIFCLCCRFESFNCTIKLSLLGTLTDTRNATSRYTILNDRLKLNRSVKINGLFGNATQ